MMHASDLVVIGILKSRFEYLRKNPDELAMMMSYYADLWPQSDAIGGSPAKYIDQAVRLFTNRSKDMIEVNQAYALSPNSNYGIYCLASSQESIREMGDYGYSEKQVLTPTVYAATGCDHIDEQEGHSFLVFRRSCGLEDKIWSLQRVVNKYFTDTFLVVAVFADDDWFTVELDGVVPLVNGVQPLGFYQFRAWESGYNVVFGTSSDTVTVRCQLVTRGDLEIHRILAMIVRWALKSGRQQMEYNNLQVATFSQSEPTPDQAGEFANGFVSSFVITGMSHDSWITFKARIPEKVTFQLQAYESDPTDAIIVGSVS